MLTPPRDITHDLQSDDYVACPVCAPEYGGGDKKFYSALVIFLGAWL